MVFGRLYNSLSIVSRPGSKSGLTLVTLRFSYFGAEEF